MRARPDRRRGRRCRAGAGEHCASSWQASSSSSAALPTRSTRPGSVERGGGKWLTAAAGVWDDVDAVLYVHPEFIDTVWQASLWMRRDTFVVAGARSLHDGVAQPPFDALEPLLRAAAAVGRAQVMIERLVLDGDVEEGTGLVLSGALLCFAEDEAGIERTALAMRSALPGATWPRRSARARGSSPRRRTSPRPSPGAFAAAGRGFEPEPPPLPFATDFGSISRRAPAALIGVGRPEGWAFHSDEGAARVRIARGRGRRCRDGHRPRARRRPAQRTGALTENGGPGSR